MGWKAVHSCICSLTTCRNTLLPSSGVKIIFALISPLFLMMEAVLSSETLLGFHRGTRRQALQQTVQAYTVVIHRDHRRSGRALRKRKNFGTRQLEVQPTSGPQCNRKVYKQQTPWPLVCERTIPTERPPLVEGI
jgi:hypothetical protein